MNEKHLTPETKVMCSCGENEVMPNIIAEADGHLHQAAIS